MKNSLAALFGPDAAQAITETFEILDAEHLLVPALSDPTEGSLVTTPIFSSLDGIAQAAGTYVLEHLDAVTGCGPDPSDDCARAFLREFAERAFRRPPTDAERDNILQVFAEARSDAIGASVAEATQHGVYAVLESPLFVYRSELGAPGDAALPVALTPHELASELSFFLTGAPPDATLLDAASTGALSTVSELEPHVDRLLASAPGRAWLAATVFGHLQLSRSERAILDGQIYPAWTPSLALAMGVELRTFLTGTLFDRPLVELLTSRRSSVNAELAALYGIAFPPSGASVDAEGFAEVELPAERRGLLTMGGTLAGLSRPSGASLVMRGLWVSSALLCEQSPPLPADTDELMLAKEAANAALPGASEREKASYRAQSSACATCHSLFDPYGVALEQFDGIGAYRSVDDNGTPIDPSFTLPEVVGGVTVTGASELGAALGASDAFAACVARTFLVSAFSEVRGSVTRDGCAVEDIVLDYRAGEDASFGGLVRAIALSRALRERSTAAP